MPWRGPAGEARHSGVTIQLGEREGKALGVPAQSEERRRSASLSRSAAQATAPLHGATPTGDVAASRAKTRPLRHRRSAASRSERAAGARTARREARAPAGQPKDSAPSRSAAGKSATSKTPAHFQRSYRTALAPAIVTDRPRRRRRLGGANPRSGICGIERGAGFPAGVKLLALGIRLWSIGTYDDSQSCDASLSDRGSNDYRDRDTRTIEFFSAYRPT